MPRTRRSATVAAMRLERWATAIAFGITALMLLAAVVWIGLSPSPVGD